MAYLLVNQAYRGLRAAESLDEALTEAISLQQLSGFIPVVPTGRRARHLHRLIVRMIHAQTSRPVEPPSVCNLELLMLRIFRLTLHAGNRRIISDAYRLALFEEAAEQADLRFFARKGEHLSPAALQRLAGVVFGLKEDGITPDNLFSDIERAKIAELKGGLPPGEEIDTAKLQDIASIYTEYERLLGDFLLDKPAALRLTTEVLSDFQTFAATSFFPPGAAIFFDGFTEFKQPETDFLKAFGPLPIPVAIRLDYSLDNGPLFGNLSETLEHLAAAGYYIRKLDEVPVFSDDVPQGARIFSPLGAYLRRWLFNTERQISHPGFSQIVSILEANDRTDEVTIIAKLLRHIVLEKNIPLADICIATRQIDHYADLTREIFAAHNIPVNVTDRYPLSKSPVTVAVFSVLDMILSGFRRQDVHRALQNPYLKFFRADSDDAIDGANLYATAQRMRLFGGLRYGGKKKWVSSLQREKERSEKRLARLQQEAFSDPLDIANAGRELTAVTKAIIDFTHLTETLPEPDSVALPSDFAALIKRSIIEKFRLRDTITDFYQQVRSWNSNSDIERNQLLVEVEKDARALSVILDLLDEIAGIQEQRFGFRKISLRDFVDKFKIAVTASKYQIREKNHFGVTLTTLEQTRGLPFRVLICCGMNDGEFPGVYIPDSFLGKELPDTEDRFIRTERMQFYQALISVLEQQDNSQNLLYLTYCTSKGEEQVVRSPFVDALLKISTLGDSAKVFSLKELRNIYHIDESIKFKAQQKEVSWINACTSAMEILKAAGQGFQLPSIKSALISDATSYIEQYRSVKFTTDKITDSLPADYTLIINQFGVKPFSVSELEVYAECPYKYYALKILRLNERKDVDSTLSGIERGTVLHTIVYRFFRQIQTEMLAYHETKDYGNGDAMLPPLAPVLLQSEQSDYYRKILHHIADEELANIMFEHPYFEMDKAGLLGTTNRTGDLDRWLDGELDNTNAKAGFYPTLFELGFGAKAVGGVVSGAVEIDSGLLLQGKIDRIEIAFNDASAQLMIADYKSGKNVKTNSDITKGLSFQMPLYILAAQKVLADKYGLNATPEAAVYYRFNPTFDLATKKANTESFVLLPKDSAVTSVKSFGRSATQIVADSVSRTELIQHSVSLAIGIVRSVSEGKHPVQPVDKNLTCKYCSYSAVCRIKEQEPQ